MEGVVRGPGGRYNIMPDERVDIVDYLDMVRIYLARPSRERARPRTCSGGRRAKQDG